MPGKAIAQVLALLPQNPVSPEGLTVRQLCRFGRHPHKGLLSRMTEADEAAIEASLAATDLTGRALDRLSGGQRQRAWIAMALAQETPILLLDEPTTFLDIAHQLEILDLLRELNEKRGRTIVMVVHDLNHAAQYAGPSHHRRGRRRHPCGWQARRTAETGLDQVGFWHLCDGDSPSGRRHALVPAPVGMRIETITGADDAARLKVSLWPAASCFRCLQFLMTWFRLAQCVPSNEEMAAPTARVFWASRWIPSFRDASATVAASKKPHPHRAAIAA